MFKRQASAGHLVNWAARLFAREADRKLKPLGLSSGQIPVLLALAEEAPLSQRALVDRSSTEQPTMAATLSRMERDGLIDRQPDPADRRIWRFSLTAKAEAALPQLYEILQEGNAAAMTDFTEEERQALTGLLFRAVGNLLTNEARTATPRRQDR